MSIRLFFREIQLQEIKARGRFGAVWKGIMTYRETDSNEEIRKTVAVKIFPMQDKNSWQAEQEIYNLPRMDHESILKFIQCERRGENLAMEYWLTTEFHEYGKYNMLCRKFFKYKNSITYCIYFV